MTFLFPGFLIAAGAVAAGVVVLHLLVTQQPRSEDLPTVRFVPDVPARSTSVAIKPSDLLLLLVRLLIILLLGAAFAQPQLTPQHSTVANIVMLDVSRAPASLKEVADSARPYLANAAAVVLFDSTAREITPLSANDSLTAIAGRPRLSQRGTLSSALITSLRAAARVRDGADSVRMVIVSPFVAEERDAAVQTLRNLWPGNIKPVRVTASVDSTATLAASQQPRIEWADSGATTMWAPREKPDTVGAFRAGNAVMVFPFVRKFKPAVSTDSVTRVYARWADGEPAAFERLSGGTCVRSVAAAMPTAGDAIMRPDFVRFLAELKEPCGSQRDFTPLPEDFLTMIEGPANPAPAASIKPRETNMTPLVPWLLLAALVFALVELLVRRISGMGQKNTETSAVNANATTNRKPGVAA